ncbi:MAG: GTP-binding protein, partial [Proteobacteria bacterium]|nr:GTP-binding protein [Pseudomonadota bacterium]
ADIINAETEIQAKIAREQLEGKLSQAISDLGEPLRNLLAEIEAYIDFPDEDISPITQEQWLDVLSKIAKKVEAYISSYQQGKICREGALVVLAGVPNAGKSSLLNRLLGEDRAIVTSIAGTTRDSLEEVASINGLRIRFCDTAGLAEEGAGRELDEVEKLGIARSWKKLENSDLTLFILDASTDFKMQEAALLNVRPTAKKLLVVANKSDLITENTKGNLLAKLKGDEVIFISAKSGDAIEELQSKIFTSVIDSNRDSSSILICSERHLEALKTTFLMLQETKVAIESKVPSEFVSANLRSALTALNDIIGVTHTEDILGRIFSKFCIGK